MNEKQREELFCQCCEEQRGMFWRLAGSFARPADQEDLFQEILLKIWQKLPQFRGDAKLSTWAYRIGLYTGMNWRRKWSANDLTRPLAEHTEAAVEPSKSADELELLKAALKLIPVQDRSLILMAMEGLSGPEMADVLGISENNAHVRLHRARQKLQQKLEQLKENELG